MPPFISHARNAEDVVLRRAFAGQPSGFYVDIGAVDPARRSATRTFYDAGWRGLNVASSAADQAALAAARPRDVTLLGTAGDPAALARLAAEHAPGGIVDFVRLDAASVAALLAGAQETQIRPRILLIEVVDDGRTLSPHDWEPMLLAAGYSFALFDGVNRFYCRAEDAALLPQLSSPACVLDDWRSAREATAAARDAALIASQAALRAQHGDYVRATLTQQRAAEAALIKAEAARDIAREEAHVVHLRLRDADAALQAEQRATARANLPALHRQLAEQRATLARLTASRSWRLTTPLRAAIRCATLLRPGG